MRTVYVLMEDSDGTMWSSPKPTGETVNTKEEAEEWVVKQEWWWQRTYKEVTIDD